MARTTVIPLQTYTAGTYEFGPVNVGNNLSRLTFEVQRCTSANPTVWPNTSDSIEMVVEISLDGGTSWSEFMRGTGYGGIDVHPKLGTESEWMIFSRAFPAGTNRRLRGRITLSANIRTSGVVDIV